MPGSHSRSQHNAIAIIGAACRLPGNIKTLSDYWERLINKVDCVSELSEDRHDLERFFSASKKLAGHSYTKAAGVLDAIKDFDPDFFGIARKEAQNMDIQQRLMLEMTWECLEQANIPPSSLRGSSTGVFIGASSMDLAQTRTDDPASITGYATTNTALSIVANRISYLFDWNGPCLTLDTACSSAFTALHLACEEIRSGRLSFAIAGGVSLLLAPFPFIGFSRAHMLSPEGKCKVFDASANGYVRSEGAGAVALKKLDQALKDKDAILAVIEGSGVNSDGRTAGISLPSGAAQAELIASVYKRFRLNPQKLAYVEAHGTGTTVGDPIEATTIGTALASKTQGTRRIHIGSAKSNIGHLEPASGMAGLLKAILVLQKGIIPPNIHFDTPNPAIDFDALNITVPTEAVDLPNLGGEELISINSFGFGGTNAHVVIGKAPQAPQSLPEEINRPAPLFFLSAQSRESLQALANEYAGFLENAPTTSLYDIAATLSTCREQLQQRAIIKGTDTADIAAKFRKLAADDDISCYEALPGNGKGVFLFTGNGSQWHGMGNDLYASSATFRKVAERIDKILLPLAGWSTCAMFQNSEACIKQFEDIDKQQPLLFAVQMGICAILAEKGIFPSAVIGHSVGEIAAAVVAGLVSMEDGVKLVHYRSCLQAPVKGMGGMIAANMSEERAKQLLKPFKNKVVVAAVNTRTSLTLSGENEALQAVLQKCRQERIAATKLPVDYPFHSAAMDFLKEDFLQAIADVTPCKASVDFYSTTTPGKVLKKLGPGYWWRNIRQKVCFDAALEKSLEQGYKLFLEIGPAPLLQRYVRDTTNKRNIRTFCKPTLTKNNKKPNALEESWMDAWGHGWKMDMGKHFPCPWNKCSLPLYPWNKKYCWFPNSPENRGFITSKKLHPLLGWQLHGKLPVFENIFSLADYAWLGDHKAGDSTPFPAAAVIETILAAANTLYPAEVLELSTVTLSRPLLLGRDVSTRVSIDSEDGGFTFESRPYLTSEAFTPCVKGRVFRAAYSTTPLGVATNLPFSSPYDFGAEVSREQLYKTTQQFSLFYGPAFQMVEKAWVRKHEKAEAFVALAAPGKAESENMLISPPLLDGAFQSLFFLLEPNLGTSDGQAYLPTFFDNITLFKAGMPRFAHAQVSKIGPRSIEAAFSLFDADGVLLLRLTGCRFRRAAWLEKEHTPSEGYQICLEKSQHPKEPLCKAHINAKDVQQAALQSSCAANEKSPAKPSVPLTALLEHTALAAIHEAVLGLAAHQGKISTLNIPALRASQALHPAYEPWLCYMLEHLEANELAQQVAGTWHIQGVENKPSFSALWRTIVSTKPEYQVLATLLACVFSQVKEILRGDHIDATSRILAPKLVEAYYNNSSLFAAPLGRVDALLQAALKHKQLETPARVLQIGQGNKSLLAQILPTLRQYTCHYTVAESTETDAEVLRSFFAKEGGITYSAMDFANIDTESAGGYALIIANQYLHRHESPVATLNKCYSLLAPGGVLCVIEHAPSLFADFVFGAEPSWWNESADATLPISRLQSEQTWSDDLLAAGFEDVTAIDAHQGHDGMASMFLAHKEDVAVASPESTARASTEEAAVNWLVISDSPKSKSGKLGEAIAAALSGHGQQTTHLHYGSIAKKDISPEKMLEYWNAIFSSIPKKEKITVIYCATYSPDPLSTENGLEAWQNRQLSLLTALATAWDKKRPEITLWVVTGGALSPAGPQNSSAAFTPVPHQGTIAGFIRTMTNELPALSIRLLDIHGTPCLSHVVRELESPTDEKEVVLLGTGRYLPRLTRLQQEDTAPSQEELSGAKLAFDTPGRLQNLHWQRFPIQEPGPGMVRIRAKYAGLNFRDVMWSMGLLPDEALENGFSGPTMGIECAGIIDAIGSGVTDFAVGDPVFGFGPACFSSHIITPAAVVIHKPKEMGFAEAATLPVAFFTAWYAIKELANMQRGERILIHGAAGGVGLAAIQIASFLGLEVYATAGAPEKHAFLRALGVKHIYSSRSLEFAPHILHDTNGEGVDVVLNSLAGEAITASLSVLRPFGRFLELGKRDFFANTPMRLRPFRNNISYFGIDVDQMLEHQPQKAQKLFLEMAQLFTSRKLIPLPHIVFPAARAVEAFQSLQQAYFLGKLVISLENALKETQKAVSLKRLTLGKEGSYLVTGGTNGLGLATARRLAKRGAKRLLLISRKGSVDAAGQAIVEEMQQMGASVIIAPIDVTNKKALQDFLKQQHALSPVKGIVHAAGVVDDSLITTLTLPQIQNVLKAKTIGAQNLHEATQGCSIDFFILYSSATTAFGNPGQANYIAANCMVESLAAQREKQGLPATVIGWGPIADTGMLTQNKKAKEVLYTLLGVSPLTSEHALDWLEHCVCEKITASHYFGINWNPSRKDHVHPVSSSRLFRLQSHGPSSLEVAEAAPLDLIRSSDPEKSFAIVTDLLLEEIASVMRLPKDAIATDVPLVSLGMDSLTGMEISLAIEQKFELTDFPLSLSEETTAASLAEAIAKRIRGDNEQEDNGLADKQERNVLLELERKHKAHLSDAEREVLLQQLK